MTDKPRDLARDAKHFVLLLTEAAVDGVECTLSNDGARQLADFIACQSRELELQREALRWCLEHGTSTGLEPGYFWKADGNANFDSIEPPAHLVPILAKALEGK